uniref:Bug family tripartite tricarboxylate transporter substrate binding protein n=1 Tax=Cupriavidus necator TaxID=106590 RepID=UPI003F494292
MHKLARSPRRRSALKLAAMVVAGLAFSAQAQQTNNWPDKPIRLVVAGTAGASADAVARVIGDALSRKLGQPVLVDPRPGAGGGLAAASLLTAPKDGYTYLVAVNSLVSEVPFTIKPQFDPFKDVVPLVELVTSPLVLVADAQTGVNSLKDMVGYVKANPGKVSFASYSAGTLSHVMGLRLNKAFDLDMVHVAYKGSSPALQDLMGGQIQFMFDGTATSQPYIRSGKLKALAVTSDRRPAVLPHVPTFAELGQPAMTQFPWIALWSTPDVPQGIQDKMRAEVIKALATPLLRDKFAALGLEISSQPPTVAQMQQVLRKEYQNVGELLRSINYKPE